MGDSDPYYDGDGVMESLPTSPEVTYNWVDITEDFFTSIKDLELGELLHDGHLFGLFEAMSAIEMMDPKMDAGMLCNRGNPKPLNFQESVEAGKLKIDNLEPCELIGIMDATFACIVSWLEGHSLAQTVFTNLYLHQPHSILNKPLKAFCIAVYKLLDSIRDCINKAQVYEEEDFQPMGYGYRLGSNPQQGMFYDPNQDVSEQRCIALLREQEDDLYKKVKISAGDQAKELLNAVAARIKFTRMIYQTLLVITKRDSQSGVDCVALLNGCSEMMKIIIKTSCKGTQPDENSECPNPMGFSPMINQRLLPPTFPRCTRVRSRPAALAHCDQLVARLRHAWRVTSCPDLHAAIDFFMEFSREKSCILSRSALQLLYLTPPPASTAALAQSALSGPPGRRPTHAFVEILRESVRSFVNPPALKSNSVHSVNAREFVENFLARCVRPFAVLLQVCGHNRARQRDKLAMLLDEFASLQDEADSVDAVCCMAAGAEAGGAGGAAATRACYGTWLLYHALRLMLAYLLAGLELELYSAHEYHYIYWYLYEFLYGWLASALARAEALAADGRRRNKHKKRVRPYAREALMCQVLQNMCGGYFKALVAFKLQNKIVPPRSQFDSEAVRYKRRLAPLAALTPPLVSYQEFLDMTRPIMNESPLILFLGGCKHFQQARTLLENITTPDQEVNDLLKVAKTNFVVLKLLAGGHKQDSATPPEFDFAAHRHYPIIKLI